MIVWALFDSGNGCYAQGVRELNEGGAKDDNLFRGIRISSETTSSMRLLTSSLTRISSLQVLLVSLGRLHLT